MENEPAVPAAESAPMPQPDQAGAKNSLVRASEVAQLTSTVLTIILTILSIYVGGRVAGWW